MILKTLTQLEDGNKNHSDCWTFYDDVDSARVYYDSVADASCVALHFKGSDSEMVLALHDVAYLCNNRGQTIEKLLPAVIQNGGRRGRVQ